MYNSDEKKEYSEGKVILSTTEYRDLVEDNIKMKADCEKKDREYWSERSKNSDLQAMIDKLTEKNQNYENFIEQNKLKESFVTYIAMKKIQEDKEIEE